MQYVTLRRRAAATIAADRPRRDLVRRLGRRGGRPRAATPRRPTCPAASSPTAQSLIMKDGNICDPIRHMGC